MDPNHCVLVRQMLSWASTEMHTLPYHSIDGILQAGIDPYLTVNYGLL